ncbi:CSN-associated deubiquitinating enzyme Ubp12 [Ceratobasidium sp. 392]|nr:CSN-associated deubiquitinating enzyme Ubp12 [Ceratobasidium sp. 392]
MKDSSGYERCTMIRIARQMPIQPDSVWFVVSRKWFQAWEVATAGIPNKAFAEVTEETLGPVDNSDIVHAGTMELLPGLVEGYQIELVPEDAWKNLVQWYGEPSVVLSRETISYPTASGLPETRVEIYRPRFYVFLLSQKSTANIPHTEFTISSRSTLLGLAEKAALVLQVPGSTRYRVWNMPPITTKTGVTVSSVERGTLLLIPRDDSTPLTDFGRMGRVFAVEVCGQDGLWPLDAELVSVSTDPNKGVIFGTDENDQSCSTNFPGRAVGLPVPRGTMGLQNLGHTCFMNSGLQCLLHIPELEQYFLENLHLHELNPTNPLSTEGKLTAAFNIVMHQVYPPEAKPALRAHEPMDVLVSDAVFQASRRVGSSSSYAARNFRDTLCQFAPVFAGFEENDSQELVGMVLDSLHEDLNRILNKPYVERPDWPEDDQGVDQATTEARIARETWAGHSRRNDSIIADLFHGMYKSTLTCMSCGKLSVTFEPYMSLALPLPATRALWKHTVHYVPWDAEKPALVIQIELPNNSNSAQLKEKLADILKAKRDHLLVAEVWKHKFFKFFDDDKNITELAAEDMLVLYELPVPVALPSSSPYLAHTESDSTPSDQPVIIPVLHQSSNSSFGLPFPVVVTHSDTKSLDNLGRAIAERSMRWTKLQGSDTTVLSGGFKLYAFDSGSGKLETGFRLGISAKPLEDLATRKSTATDGRPLVQSTEAIVCDWHPDVKEKAFSGANSRFEHWEPYLCPSELSQPTKPGPITLEDCLDELTKLEQLGASDSWYCSRCKQHRQATKQLELWSTPNILILQIKRFTKGLKIDELVTFPIQNLDLSTRAGQQGTRGDYIYDLFAVDEHKGGNLSTGAYTAYAKNESDGAWYHYKDAIVSPSTPEATINPGAYLLFYRRRTASVEAVINKAKSHINRNAGA